MATEWRGAFNPDRGSGIDADGMPLLALSLRQPWLWAVLKAGKRVENRKWSTTYRGPLLLHASKGCTEEEVEDFIEFVWEEFGAVRAGEMMAMLPCPIPKLSSIEHGFYRGGICGIATLVDVTEKHDGQLALQAFEPLVESRQSRWRIRGQHGWILDDVGELPFVPCNGALGLFTPDQMTLDAVHAALRKTGWHARS